MAPPRVPKKLTAKCEAPPAVPRDEPRPAANAGQVPKCVVKKLPKLWEDNDAPLIRQPEEIGSRSPEPDPKRRQSLYIGRPKRDTKLGCPAAWPTQKEGRNPFRRKSLRKKSHQTVRLGLRSIKEDPLRGYSIVDSIENELDNASRAGNVTERTNVAQKNMAVPASAASLTKHKSAKKRDFKVSKIASRVGSNLWDGPCDRSTSRNGMNSRQRLLADRPRVPVPLFAATKALRIQPTVRKRPQTNPAPMTSKESNKMAKVTSSADKTKLSTAVQTSKALQFVFLSERRLSWGRSRPSNGRLPSRDLSKQPADENSHFPNSSLYAKCGIEEEISGQSKSFDKSRHNGVGEGEVRRPQDHLRSRKGSKEGNKEEVRAAKGSFNLLGDPRKEVSAELRDVSPQPKVLVKQAASSQPKIRNFLELFADEKNIYSIRRPSGFSPRLPVASAAPRIFSKSPVKAERERRSQPMAAHLEAVRRKSNGWMCFRGARVSVSSANRKDVQSFVAQIHGSPPTHHLRHAIPRNQSERRCKKTSIDDIVRASKPIPRSALIDLIRSSRGLPIKTQLAYYRIDQQIGEGSYGKVFKAYSVLTGTPVAIKCCRKPSADNVVGRQRMAEEIRIMSQLSHPGIIRLFDVFEDAHFMYLVMEYVHGGDLLSLVKQHRRFAERDFLPIFRQLIESIGYVHLKGVVHRDVKLDNVLLNQAGQAKLCDFGIAIQTTPGQLIFDHIGTPAYLAPEVLTGKGYRGFEADVWGLGVTAYIALTGQGPFRGRELEELQYNIVNDGLHFPADAKITPLFRTLISLMLEKETKNRITIPELAVQFEVELGFGSEFSMATLDHSRLETIKFLGFDEGAVVRDLQSRTMNLGTAAYHML